MLNNAVDKIRSSAEDLIKDKRALIKILSIAVILILALIFRTHDSAKNEIAVEAVSENTEAEDVSEVCIDIGGAVKRPGVYRVDNGTRLYEVIELAGGLRSDADPDSVNQASYVEDGAKIIIPVSSSNNNGILPDDVRPELSGDIVSGSSGVKDPSAVNINTADKEQLKTLSGIGDAIAERIIEYRSESRFKSKEDIMYVKGIGSAIYDKIKDKIVV